MPRTLSDVIHEYAVKYHAEFEQATARTQEWVDAVRRLMDQLRQWLKEADKDGVLRIDEDVYQHADQVLGRYEVTGLTCFLGTQQVKVRPMGPTTLGKIEDGDRLIQPRGRVDLRGGEYTYLLFRVVEPAGERWVMMDAHSQHSVPLTREAFEAALVRMLDEQDPPP